MKWKVLARHRRWVDGATITESVRDKDEDIYSYRRYTATIRGWRNWLIYEGPLNDGFHIQTIINNVQKIKERIDAGDDSVFRERTA